MSTARGGKPDGAPESSKTGGAPRGTGAAAAEDGAAPARPASPGRYSMATEGSTQVAALRIDSTRMPAVRADGAPPPPPPSSGNLPPPLPAAAKGAKGKNAPPLPPPSRQGTKSPTDRAAPPPPPPSTREVAKAAAAAAAAAAASPPAAAPPPAAPAEAAPPAAERPKSLPPPPPPKRASSAPPSLDFDEGSIAFAFDALMSEGTTGVAGRGEVDLTPVRELFAELAANHMRHVRDFMIDMKWGEAPREWIDICIPAVVSLRRAAERLELTELAAALERWGGELETATPAKAVGGSKLIEGAEKEKLLESYGALVTLLPQAFALDRDKSMREAVIVQSLCLSVPDVRKVTIDKLHQAGLTSLSVLFEAQPEEVAQVAGIPLEVAVRIVERFQAYRRELQNASPQDARAAEREKLASLTAKLRELHDGYEEASRGWSPDAKGKKRDLFRGREETWLSISLLLARFGEVDRLQGIEKVPFAQRIAQLTDYLEEAREKYRTEI